MRPPDRDVLIAGGGLAAQRCCQTLRRLGFDGRIALICEEGCPPYDRPPLSKAFLTNNQASPRLAIKPASWYVENDVELLLGLTARELDITGRRVTLDKPSKVLPVQYGKPPAARHRAFTSLGRTVRYRHLVIATGSHPRRLPGIPLGPKVHELRTHADASSLRAALRDRTERLAILGAGLIGLEVASSARRLGLQVTMIEAAATPLGRALPLPLGDWLARLHREQGVDLRLETIVRRIAVGEATATLDLSDGSAVRADTVLVAAGTVPATEWLARSGLGPGPIPTDAGGRTRIPGVYAAGDAACFPDPYSGERSPTPHWEAAVRQGVAVAHSIVGLRPRSQAPAMFWSDQYDSRIQFVGHAPAESEIQFDGGEDDREYPETRPTEIRIADVADIPFSAWIRHNGQPVAAMLVNRPDALGQARRWIADAALKETQSAA